MPDDARPAPVPDDPDAADAREDLLARHALGAATGNEADEAARLIAADGEAAALAADYAALAGVLPALLAEMDAEPHTPAPDPALKARVLAAVDGRRSAVGGRQAGQNTSRARRAGSLRAFAAWAMVVALAATSVGLWGANRDLRRDAAPAQTAIAHAARSPRTYAMGGTANAPAAHAVLFASPADGGRVVLLTSGFPQIGSGQEYRVWMRHADGSHTAAGSFICDGKGDATLVVPGSLAGVRAVTITAETKDRPAAAPTGPVVMSGPLPPDDTR